VISLDLALNDLHRLSLEIDGLDRDLAGLSRSGLSIALETEKREELLATLDKRRARRKQYILDQIVRFPPHHDRHSAKLVDFWKNGTFDESVFIMTKFPVGDRSPGDNQLASVIDMARKAIEARGYKARVASDHKYHPLLWDNVELYLAGCRHGVAIVEDRYLKELNPNVAMEWGWMRGMGRDVGFLIEKNFDHLRADWDGLLKDRFDWDQPDTIVSAIAKVLPEFKKSR
jgi:hypothetical protein